MQDNGISNSEIQGKDFNFQDGLEKFSQLKINEEQQNEGDDASYTKGTTMDSFFDTIGNAAASGGGYRGNRDEQRKQNLDTFGVEGLQRDRNQRRGPRRHNNNRRSNNNNRRTKNQHSQQQQQTTTQ